MHACLHECFATVLPSILYQQAATKFQTYRHSAEVCRAMQVEWSVCFLQDALVKNTHDIA